MPKPRSRSVVCASVLAPALWLIALAGCGEPAEPTVEQAPAVDVRAAQLRYLSPDSTPIVLEILAIGMVVPWDLDFAQDGRIFLTERPGRIRVVRDEALEPQPWAELAVFAEDPALLPESGLMGIALAPDFDRTGHVYVMATVHRAGNGRLARLADRVVRGVRTRLSLPTEAPWENRIYRLTDRGGKGVEPEMIVAGLPSSYYHAGGALRFGPDGMLYATIGDIIDSDRAQDPTSRVGAVLRYTPEGEVPSDNPFAGSPVFAHGLRNVQALAWHPETGEMFATEHGPSFLPHENGRWGHDEVNRIVAGGNYGWPVVAGATPDARFRTPLVDWRLPLAPAGLAVYGASSLPWQGELLVTGLRGQQLRKLKVERGASGEPLRIAREDTLIANEFGRLRAVRVGPDGAIYFTTSNRDGRGEPTAIDDRLLRLRPAATR